MYKILDVHFLTVIIIIGSMMVTPLYIFGVYVFSGASPKKGMQIGILFLLFGALMSWVSLIDASTMLAPLGYLIIPLSWLLPSLILYQKRDWFLSEKLSQNWVIGYQAFRVIGGVFLIEMVIGNLPGIFAYPAGLGDVLVGIVAIGVLLVYRNSERIPKTGIFLVLGLGIPDLLSAFFFGFTSAEGPVQLFYPAVINNVRLFPIGMIPLFLVPTAIFFHTLSLLNYFKYERA